ncbi:hypothetical protein [Streptomyces sp. NPDC052036]|uniref:hypothetical protein n=1 Tax=Streptomyces sp. NPDC052036 TaxID=3155171 RepID=UPI00343773AD
MALDHAELAHGLFRILETGDPALAADVVAEDNHNREAAVATPGLRHPRTGRNPGLRRVAAVGLQ